MSVPKMWQTEKLIWYNFYEVHQSMKSASIRLPNARGTSCVISYLRPTLWYIVLCCIVLYCIVSHKEIKCFDFAICHGNQTPSWKGSKVNTR